MNRIDTWLLRSLVVLLLLLIGLSCYLLWRTSMIALRVEESVVAVSADVKEVTQSAARISRQMADVTERLARIEEKTEDAVGLKDLETAMGTLADVRNEKYEDPKQLSPEAQAEIDHLLKSIRTSGLVFICGSEHLQASVFYVHLWVKFKYHRKIVGSAEDFIQKVATKTISEHRYRVVSKDGKTTDLADWLKDQLSEYRKAEPHNVEKSR
jgi:hypothetical protein